MRRRGRARPGSPPQGDRAPAELSEPGRFHWIVDGHNAIFAVPAWESLQVSGHRGAARRALEERLEAFGRAAGVQVVVVYDGNELERNPDAVDRPHLRSAYSWPPEIADDRIRYLAEQALREGRRPVVVTSDRRTLTSSLPPGVRVVEVPRFFQEILGRLLLRPEKQVESDGLREIERHFLRQSPHPEDRAAADALDEPGAADRDGTPDPT